MPYNWTTSETRPGAQELHLWPHQSLAPKGFAVFIAITFAMLLVPLVPFLGSVVLWGILPFILLALTGIWVALKRSRQNAQIIEVLTLSGDRAHLVRRNPRGEVQEWDCNRYWARTEMHVRDGPVPHYVTLSGNGRNVEIGAFLSEDERLALYDELSRALHRP
ncbi:DUF2244 domain-containing protein [Aestuariivita sp.]|jgi:uncharacterized membrane protein|uniref:DUF2244 domain-containing protein n=1 Tax=Aestuariivita sp. TaxID=1872407 RepID=UPI00216EC441|nr:DUF2244 domain-containing protein [Aestuariivita sp.]MCE8006828.1 DUF2244 domain-containing protein [Aestuariivita sp.]